MVITGGKNGYHNAISLPPPPSPFAEPTPSSSHQVNLWAKFPNPLQQHKKNLPLPPSLRSPWSSVTNWVWNRIRLLPFRNPEKPRLVFVPLLSSLHQDLEDESLGRRRWGKSAIWAALTAESNELCLIIMTMMIIIMAIWPALFFFPPKPGGFPGNAIKEENISN